MEEVTKLIEKLSWNTPEEDKEDAIKKLQYIKDEDLHLLLQPISKSYWDGAAEVVVNLGYPRVKRILAGLLEWIQDMNWPGARQISVFLREIGDPIIPYIKDALNQHSDDSEWTEWIFDQIIDHWDTSQVQQIQGELIQISQGRTADVQSMRILLIHGLLSKEEIHKMLQEKKELLVIELMELETSYPELDCEELDIEFKKLIFMQAESLKHYYDENKESFSICNKKSYLQNYLSDIKALVSEVAVFNSK